MPDRGRNGGITGIIDIAGQSGLFGAWFLAVKSDSLETDPIETTGRGDTFRQFDVLDATGALVVICKVQKSVYPTPASLKGITATVTQTYDTGVTKTATVQITSAVYSYKKQDADYADAILSCQYLTEPELSGFGGTQPAAASFPSLSYKQTWEQLARTIDPYAIQSGAVSRFRMIGVPDTDADEYSMLATFAASTLASLVPFSGLKVRTATFTRTDSWGGFILVQWGLTSTVEDLINPHINSTVDPDSVDNSGEQGAVNEAPVNPNIPNTLLARTTSQKINDTNTMYIDEWRKVTPRQEIDLLETSLTVDNNDLETGGQHTRLYAVAGTPPTITINGNGNGALAYPIVGDDGSIIAIEVVSGGNGYTHATATAAGGSGSGFTCGAVTIIAAAVTAVAIQTAGENYGSWEPDPPPWLPTIDFTDATGQGAVAYCVTDANGAVISIEIASGGSGYTAPTASATGGYGSGFVAGSVTVAHGKIVGVDIGAGGTGYQDASHPDLQIVRCKIDSISAFHSKAAFYVGMQTPLNEAVWGETMVTQDSSSVPLESEATIKQLELVADDPATPSAAITGLKNVGYTQQQATLSRCWRRYRQKQMDSNDEKIFPLTQYRYSPQTLIVKKAPAIGALEESYTSDLDGAITDFITGIFTANQADPTFDGVEVLELLPGGHVLYTIIKNYEDKTITCDIDTNYEIVKSNGSFVRVALGELVYSGRYAGLVMPQGLWRTKGSIFVKRRIVSTGEFGASLNPDQFGLAGAAETTFLGLDGPKVMYGGAKVNEPECETLVDGGRLIVIDYVFKVDSLAFQDDASVITGMYCYTPTDVTTPGDYDASIFNWTINYPGTTNLSTIAGVS